MNPRQRKWQKSRRRKGERRYRADLARACANADAVLEGLSAFLAAFAWDAPLGVSVIESGPNGTRRVHPADWIRRNSTIEGP